MTSNSKTCTETVYDSNGDVERETCGATLIDGCKYGMCPRCHKATLEWAYSELYDARKKLYEAEQNVLALGGGI